MTNAIGPNGNTSGPQVIDQPRLDVSPSGQKDGLPVSSVPPASNFNQLNPAGPDNTGLDQRAVEKLENVTPTPGLAEPEEIDNKTFEELQEVENKTLANAGRLLKKTEEFKVLDLALNALNGKYVDPRHKLKITLQMPNEPPPPLNLIPMDKNVSERADFNDLMKLAESLLQDHLSDGFEGFDYRGSQEKLNTLKETLDGNAKRMEKKDPDFASEWKEKYGQLEQRQAYINVGDTYNRLAAIFGADKNENEKLNDPSDPISGPVLSVQAVDSDEEAQSLWAELTPLEPETFFDPDDQEVAQEVVQEEPAEDTANPLTSPALKAELSNVLKGRSYSVGEGEPEILANGLSDEPESTEETTDNRVPFSEEPDVVEDTPVEVHDYPSISPHTKTAFTAELKERLKSQSPSVGEDEKKR